MSEEVTTTEETTEVAEMTPAEQTESYINGDGTFKEGWQDHLIPTEIHGRSKMLWSGFKSVDDMIRQIETQDLTIQRKGLRPPADDAGPEEIKAFHKLIGVPDTPDGYTLTIPDDVKQYYQDDELMTEAKQTLHSLGLTPKQFAGVMALDAMRMRKAEEEMAADPISFYEQALEYAMPIMAQEAEKELRLKWGAAYDTRLQLANAAITETVPEGDQRNQLLERIGNDPLIADFIATIQNKHYTESHGVDTSLGTGAVSKNVQQQIDDVSKQLTPELKQSNRPLYDELLAKKNKLYVQLYPDK